ncbi:Nucleotide-binding universal stress protein, UspA family [Dethiosulfatibacter aminovorans DSM 17477]|uniref:Nucleotide-binding universal stress protein, UspA family n=1 Tax=Dethiosulfatibacter aminovorans DSM 17477 TaxID=1121476 RepID=A0A1M6J0D9_9FIRM|nr:universal stress protein [Dethiosulfatibacter aminovorans]SHJ40121.1 Nucleotide-binding universal stress protein, UspA family [Dethiosulfatibacter aminovorans DSM 17477]
MKKILLPKYGSMKMDDLISAAENLAKKFNSTVTVFHVFNCRQMPHYGTSAVDLDDDDIVEFQKELDDTVKLLKDKGIRVDSKLFKGDPATDIINEAESGNYDIVIMSTQGIPSGQRLLPGSVTGMVMNHIDIPVLVIR